MRSPLKQIGNRSAGRDQSPQKELPRDKYDRRVLGGVALHGLAKQARGLDKENTNPGRAQFSTPSVSRSKKFVERSLDYSPLAKKSPGDSGIADQDEKEPEDGYSDSFMFSSPSQSRRCDSPAAPSPDESPMWQGSPQFLQSQQSNNSADSPAAASCSSSSSPTSPAWNDQTLLLRTPRSGRADDLVCRSVSGDSFRSDKAFLAKDTDSPASVAAPETDDDEEEEEFDDTVKFADDDDDDDDDDNTESKAATLCIAPPTPLPLPKAQGCQEDKIETHVAVSEPPPPSPGSPARSPREMDVNWPFRALVKADCLRFEQLFSPVEHFKDRWRMDDRFVVSDCLTDAPIFEAMESTRRCCSLKCCGGCAQPDSKVRFTQPHTTLECPRRSELFYVKRTTNRCSWWSWGRPQLRVFMMPPQQPRQWADARVRGEHGPQFGTVEAHGMGVDVYDREGELAYVIRGSWWQPGRCLWPCFRCNSCRRVKFDVRECIEGVIQDAPVGSLVKFLRSTANNGRWPHIGDDFIQSNTCYLLLGAPQGFAPLSVSLPDTLKEHKALLMAAVFLLDAVHFKRSRRKSRDKNIIRPLARIKHTRNWQEVTL